MRLLNFSLSWLHREIILRLSHTRHVRFTLIFSRLTYWLLSILRLKKTYRKNLTICISVVFPFLFTCIHISRLNTSHVTTFFAQQGTIRHFSWPSRKLPHFPTDFTNVLASSMTLADFADQPESWSYYTRIQQRISHKSWNCIRVIEKEKKNRVLYCSLFRPTFCEWLMSTWQQTTTKQLRFLFVFGENTNGNRKHSAHKQIRLLNMVEYQYHKKITNKNQTGVTRKWRELGKPRYYRGDGKMGKHTVITAVSLIACLT